MFSHNCFSCVVPNRQCAEIEKIASFTLCLYTFRFTQTTTFSISFGCCECNRIAQFNQFEWNMSWFQITIEICLQRDMCASVCVRCLCSLCATAWLQYVWCSIYNISANLILNARSINICTGVLNWNSSIEPSWFRRNCACNVSPNTDNSLLVVVFFSFYTFLWLNVVCASGSIG